MKRQLFILISILGLGTAALFISGCNNLAELSPEDQIRNQKIYIIGPSTVRYDNNMPGDIGANHSQYASRVGWGSELHNYMHYPANVCNQGRRSSNSGTYQIPEPEKGPAHWANTRQLIENDGTDDGGFLLIQFGGTDNYQGTSEEDYKDNLRFYRDQALALNLTPVFVTSVESRTTGPGGTRGPFPQYMRDVAGENDQALMLDLHAKSLAVYLEKSTKNLGYEFGNVPFLLLGSGSFSRIDNTHFEVRGARTVARWIRELAWELEDQSLGLLFSKGFVPPTVMVYSHSEYVDDPADPDINGWYVADSQGNINLEETNRIVSTVYDEDKESMVNAFTEHPDENFFVHGDWRDDSEASWANSYRTNIRWDCMFTSGDYRIYIEVLTNDGHRIFTYKPLDIDEGPGQTFPQYLRFGLGTDSVDGSWRSFARDLTVDLRQWEPDNVIIQVNGFRMKGTGQMDDLQMY